MQSYRAFSNLSTESNMHLKSISPPSAAPGAFRTRIVHLVARALGVPVRIDGAAYGKRLHGGYRYGVPHTNGEPTQFSAGSSLPLHHRTQTTRTPA